MEGGVFSDSVDVLLTQLCKHHLQDTQKRAYIVQPQTSRDVQCKRLKRKAYNTLFEFLKGRGRYSCISPSDPVKKEIDGILIYAYHLRCNRFFDEANRLEALLDTLLSKDGDKSDVMSVLLLLVLLSERRNPTSSEVIGHASQKLPLVTSKRTQHMVLPEGPPVYGDSQVVCPDSFYMHYPRELFEAAHQQTDIRTKMDIKRPNLFELTPGTELSGNGWFNYKPLLNDAHEKEARMTMFGGLVQGRITSLDVKLELPELPDEFDMKCPEIRIPKVMSSSQLSQDTNDTFISTSMTTFNDSAIEENIWDLALKCKRGRYYTWERRGIEGSIERPYFSEAGPLAVDKWYSQMLLQLQVIAPGVVLPPRREISQSQLLKDVIYLLIGVESHTFKLDEATQSFMTTEGVYVTGITPDALSNCLRDFVACGSNYYRLNLCSKAPVVDSFYEKGMVYQAYTGAVRKVLQHYRAVILSVPPKTTLLQLKFTCERTFQQIRFLSQLCWCGRDSINFPTGIQLLTYLYQETLEAMNTDNYPMMLAILQTACGPYTVFVQEWVFHGSFRDVYGEFTIQVNHQYLEYRDKHYWTDGYALAAEQIEDSAPVFLRDMACDIFICGKTINLLKICCPEHFVCQVDDSDIPHVTVTFSERQLSTLDTRCQIYVSKMQQIARNLTISREQMVEQAEQAKRDLMEKAHTVASQEIARLQAKIDERKKAADMKKRQEFQRLKSQMVTDLQRRAGEKEQSAEEDKEHMARLTRSEEAMEVRELQLEQEAREELVKYYAELSEDAAQREQKALWKVRRSRLELARVDFLSADQEKWRREMEEATEAKAVLERDQDTSLPVWAEKVNDSPDGNPVIADDTEPDAAALPMWAERGLTAPPAAVYGLDTSAEQKLPGWARKGLETYSVEEEPVVVEGGDGDGLHDGVFVSPRKKTGLRMNESFTASKESEESPEKKTIRVFEEMHCTTESDGVGAAKPQVKLMQDRHATTETVPDEEYKPIVKISEEMHATKETESSDQKPHIKVVLDVHANMESTSSQEVSAPKLKRHSEQHANVETTSKEWKVKKQNFFGHVSKISGLEYDITAPKLKKHAEIYANLQSDTNDFAIRPMIKINKALMVNMESQSAAFKPMIRVDKHKHSSRESEFVDLDERRLKKFRIRNIHGHSSDSTVQKLLYGEKYGSPSSERGEKELEHVTDTSMDIMTAAASHSMWMDNEIDQYQDNFDCLNEPPVADLMASTPMAYGSWGDYGISLEGEVEAFRYMPLPAILHRTITASLKAQVNLVNKCIIDYFFSELKIQSHFEALRSFLFMGDGDFAQILSDILLDKLAQNPLPQEMLNPFFLNGALTKSLQLSMHSEDKFADNLSFAVKYSPTVFQPNAHDTLDCLELRYKVDWPMNIVLTDSCMTKYGRIFSFMLQLKRLVWALKDILHRLKRDSIINKAGNSPQFRRLQLHRWEMMHFVKVIQEYIANQILLLTWSEFMDAVHTDVHNLDDLHHVHARYLENAIFRSLQNKKAAFVMKIIQDTFSLILKFRSQLVSAPWIRDANTGEMTHPNFNNMVASYDAFKAYTLFLFKVVKKLALRGYQPHLQELLLRFNFNNHYDKS
ncbi:gamma-tubulin complex component 6-like [Haliotis cracherodii]|uniref:gamma-tubulin complex component 6-like n=1 Tax=Haliotis cracherodii TaxID=6455 RepID=UPI0039E83AEA